MYAGHLHGDDLWWYPASTEFYPKAYGAEPEPVQVTIDPEGTYWGWLETGGDVPIMVYPHKTLFEVCFPYGYRAEEEKGKGHAVRLRIEAR